MFVSTTSNKTAAEPKMRQIALGFVMKYNDKKVLHLRELNGGKFERTYHCCLQRVQDLML